MMEKSVTTLLGWSEKTFFQIAPHHPSKHLATHPKLTFGKFGEVGT